jgi:hypothetical protein
MHAPALLLALGAALSGCGSESETETTGSASSVCRTYDATSADLKLPVSFRANVAPLLQASCGLSSSCHGGARAPVLSSRLDVGALREGLVLRASQGLPRMPYVTPSSPAESYLMRKMDGDQCLFDVECASGSCKRAMPDGDAPLPAPQRDLVRRWIAQGAPDN